MVGIWGEAFVAFINRADRETVKIRCPVADESQCTDIIAVPEYDLRMNPYLIVRNCKAINLLDLRNLKLARLC